MNLQTELTEGSRSHKTYAKRLLKLEITKLEDLLYHIPFRYEDYTVHSTIEQLQEGEIVTVKGEVVEAKNTYTRRFKTIQKIILQDSTGLLDLTWFNQPFIPRSIKHNDVLSVSGRVEKFGNKVTMISPEYELMKDPVQPTVHTGRLVPIYPETAGVSSKWLRRNIFQLLTDYEKDLQDFLPEIIRKEYTFPNLIDALWKIHFPDSFEDIEKGRERLSFDELFLLQLAALERKNKWKAQHKGYSLDTTQFKTELKTFISSLPFTLTNSQQKAITMITNDMNSDRSMNRLLQGDVGSGKTIIAAAAIYHVYLHGYTSIIMAPTEILAEQHYATLTNLLIPLGIKVGIATRNKKLNKEQGIDVLIGTHAVLSQKISLNKLGLVIIDEQQRFGVAQRGTLREKGVHPHLLTMTATPIPRTAALALYGDLDVSYLTEMPKGRKAVKTWVIPPEKRNGAYEWIKSELLTHDSQAFIICPFIEDSENMQTIKAATTEYIRLQKEVYPDLSLGLLHGKLKAKEKEQVLQEFRDKKYHILVATPVVEVGINIPNATIIMIEGAERFGLAGLHQLRGRVGRGDKQSYCLLFTQSKTEHTTNRLKAMETTQLGAELAEYDLKMRGPGEVYGTRQSGVSMLKIASFSDTALIAQAKEKAQTLFPQLSHYPLLQKKLEHSSVVSINPD